MQHQTDSATMQKILYWNTGAPSYRWREIIRQPDDFDTTRNSNVVLAFLLLNVAIYDATIAIAFCLWSY